MLRGEKVFTALSCKLIDTRLMSNTLRIDFDLTKHHLTGDEHYVTPKTRNPAEEARQKELRKGVLMSEFQLDGLQLAHGIFHILHKKGEIELDFERPVTDINKMHFAQRFIVDAAVNTAWYLYGRNAPGMRRRQKLARLDQPELIGSGSRFLDSGLKRMQDTVPLADALTTLGKEAKMSEERRRQRVFGRAIGDTALVLAAVDLVDCLYGEPLAYSGPDMQEAVFRRSLMMFEDASTVGHEVGLPPSLAQFADRDSHLAQYWRKHADNASFDAWDEAAAEVLEAA